MRSGEGDGESYTGVSLENSKDNGKNNLHDTANDNLKCLSHLWPL